MHDHPGTVTNLITGCGLRCCEPVFVFCCRSGLGWGYLVGLFVQNESGKIAKNCRQPASDECLRGMVFVQRDVEPTRVLATAMAGCEARQGNSEIFILTGNIRDKQN